MLTRPGHGPDWVTATMLREHHVITDPTGALGLHDEQVVVTGTAPSDLDPSLLLVDYAVPGSTATGCFTVEVDAQVQVQVLGGAL